MKRGYARVSTDQQELGRQIDALQKAGCEVIYTDTISGTKKSRPELDKMLSDLKPGDTVVVQKLDRLGRSMINLLELIERFKQTKIEFVCLADHFDTSTPAGVMMLNILGSFAQFERDIIAERTKNALQFKKTQGVVLGAPRKLKSEVIKAVKSRRLAGLTVNSIAQEMNISQRSVYNAINTN